MVQDATDPFDVDLDKAFDSDNVKLTGQQVIVRIVRPIVAHVKALGAGGGGGGCGDRTGAGGAGKRGMCLHEEVKLHAGLYVVKLGQPGRGGKGEDGKDGGTPGTDGGDTTIVHAGSGKRMIPAAAGGKGGRRNAPSAENGEASRDENGKVWAKGGRAGTWNKGGQDAQGYGAGGGGCGEQGGDHPLKGGDGGGGYLWIQPVALAAD